MISFPCCKINLGLYVTGKRTDGYHNLETAFFPVSWCDALEINHHPEGRPFELRVTGPVSPGNGKNILEKAWELIRETANLPPALVLLYKNIPTGAGLGGGSSDAAFFLRLVNDFYKLGIDKKKLHGLALELGSDCPFFLDPKPMLASGRGELFRPLNVSLDNFYILVVHPGIHISTAAAFAMINPGSPEYDLSDALHSDPDQWKHTVKNDFEAVAIKMHPQLGALKNQLYEAGAFYASMSGSGGSFFGLFREKPTFSSGTGYRTFLHEPVTRIL